MRFIYCASALLLVIRALAATGPHPHLGRHLRARHPDIRHDQTLVRVHAASAAAVAAP